jgi:hypothetical protein
VTNEEIDRQFSDVMEQMRRVDRLTAEQEQKDVALKSPWHERAPHLDPEH